MRFFAARVLPVLVLLVSGGVIFLSTMPLNFVLDKVTLPEKIKINSVTGSVWSGQMQAIWQGQTLKEIPWLNQPFTVMWQWCPGSQPLRMCITLDSHEIKASGHVFYAVTSHAVALTDTVLRIQLQDYAFRFKTLSMSVSGDGRFNVDNLLHELGQPLPDTFGVNGTIMSLSHDDILLGDYQLTARLVAKQLDVDIKGGTEIFSMQGKAELDLEGPRLRYSYSADLSSENKIFLAALAAYAQDSGAGKITFTGRGTL